MAPSTTKPLTCCQPHMHARRRTSQIKSFASSRVRSIAQAAMSPCKFCKVIGALLKVFRWNSEKSLLPSRSLLTRLCFHLARQLERHVKQHKETSGGVCDRTSMRRRSLSVVAIAGQKASCFLISALTHYACGLVKL